MDELTTHKQFRKTQLNISQLPQSCDMKKKKHIDFYSRIQMELCYHHQRDQASRNSINSEQKRSKSKQFCSYNYNDEQSYILLTSKQQAYKLKNKNNNQPSLLPNKMKKSPLPSSYKNIFQLLTKQKSSPSQKLTKIKSSHPKINNINLLSLYPSSNNHSSIYSSSSSSTYLCNQTKMSKNKYNNHTVSQSINKNNDKSITYQKFIHQITTILTHLFKAPTPSLLNNRISYIQYLQTLKSLKMIHKTYEPTPNDTVSQLWAQHISGSSIGNLIITITSILSLYQGKYTDNYKILCNKFQILKTTRQQLIKQSLLKSRKQNSVIIIPQLSQKYCKQIKSNSKTKKINCYNQVNTVNIDRALTQRTNASIIYDDTSKVSVNEYNDQNFCINYTQPTSQYKPDNSGIKRSQILYEKSKQKQIKNKYYKTTEEIQYWKNYHQLTFKPKISKIKNVEEFKNKKCVVKGQKNIINRMIKGRVQRQIRKTINQKGIPYNEKLVDKMRKQKYQQIISSTSYPSSYLQPQTKIQTTTTHKIPIPKLFIQPKPDSNPKPLPSLPQQDLIIDVYISQQHKQKLIIRKGEPLQQVATRFITQNNIPIQKKQQLLQLLQLSISHALCPIDQLVQQEDQLASARSQYPRQFFK